jgi:hypothetical protein
MGNGKKALGNIVRNGANAFGQSGSRCHSSSFLGGEAWPQCACQREQFSHLVWVGTLSISCGVVSTCAAI